MSEAWDFVERLTLDPDLSPVQARIGLLMFRHVNAQTGEAYPSIDRLVALLQTSKRTVIDAERKLVELGYFTVSENGGGRGNRRCFKPAMEARKSDVELIRNGAKKGTHTAQNEPLNSEAGVPKEAVKGTLSDVKGTVASIKGTPTTPEQGYEQGKEQKQAAAPLSRARPREAGDGDPPAEPQPSINTWPPPERPPDWASIDLVTRGLPAECLAEVWDRWRNHRLSRGQVAVDVQADWRNWCGEERKRRASGRFNGAGPPPKTKTGRRISDVPELQEKLKAARGW